MPLSATTARRATGLLAAGVVAAVLPASGDAGYRNLGSDLSLPADTTEARQADTAYWQTRLHGGGGTRVPVNAQVLEVRIKGIARSNPRKGVPGGETMFHIQALRPLRGGKLKVRLTSQAFFLPTSGDPQQIRTYRPVNLCVKARQRVAFNTVGGWDGIPDGSGPYPQGTPLQIFGASPAAEVAEYTRADGTNNGDVLKGRRRGGRELLMRLKLATGRDRSYECGGRTRR
ncbi:MAG: hypothetical protein M3P50_04955 [Actinomycetota bacterium]|nr:hypothetical protein [Actinomycetota bacterium]